MATFRSPRPTKKTRIKVRSSDKSAAGHTGTLANRPHPPYREAQLGHRGPCSPQNSNPRPTRSGFGYFGASEATDGAESSSAVLFGKMLYIVLKMYFQSAPKSQKNGHRYRSTSLIYGMNMDALRGDVALKSHASVRTVCFILEAPCHGKCRTGHDFFTCQ